MEGGCTTLLDEVGYLPIDKTGADLNNDANVTSAVLDRLLHHAETVIVEGKSYRMKDRIEEP